MSGYTIGEIIVWLLLAAILGFILGWLVRQMKCQREHGAGARSLGQVVPVTAAAPIGDSTLPGTGGGAAKKAATTKAPVAKKAPTKKTVVTKAPAAKKAPTAKKAATTRAPVAKKAATKTANRTAAKKVVTKAPAEQGVTAGRFPGSAKPLAGGRAPSADYRIKGNEDSMIYHTPDSPFYGQTIAETWFKTEQAAVAAGFRKPKNA